MLTEEHRLLLYEIYGVTPLNEVYAATGVSVGLILPASFTLTRPIVDQIEKAFTWINEVDERADRVEVILEEYKTIALDPSNIDREGYQFRIGKSLQRIRDLLRPYTGIYMVDNSGTGGGLIPV
jgi:hypothetical protein